jgi:uncharacterized protein
VQQVRSDHGRGCDGGGEILSYSRAMAGNSGDRSAYFEAIEAKHGEPVDVWLDRLKASGETTYPAQMALLRDRYKFSRTHANAVVMWFRGSTTSQRFDQPESYFLSIEPEKALLMKRIFDLVLAMRSDAELVIAWNQPMVRIGTSYVLGISALKAHLTINPFQCRCARRCEPVLDWACSQKAHLPSPARLGGELGTCGCAGERTAGRDRCGWDGGVNDLRALRGSAALRSVYGCDQL